MKTSSPYPVLDNRPIDQWKVTELKEELKRRKLTIKGLKEDLIKRLCEAIRIEREDAEQVDNGIDDPDAEIADEVSKTVVADTETGESGDDVPLNDEETVGNDDGKDSKMDDVSVQGDIGASAEQSIQDKSLEEKELELVNDQPPQVEILPANHDKSLEEKESELVNDQPPQVEILSANQGKILEEKESELVNDQPQVEILPANQDKSLEEKESELINDQPPQVEILAANQDKSLEEKESELVNDQPPQVEILPANQDKILEEKESELVNDQPPQMEILPENQHKSPEEKDLELVNDQPTEVGILPATEEPPELELLPASQDSSLEEKESELVNVQPPKVEILSAIEEPSEVEILSATEEPSEVEILPASQDKSHKEKEVQLVNDQPPKVEVLSATEVPSAGVGDKACESLSSETVTSKPGFEDDKMERDDDDLMAQQGSEDIKPSDVDVKLDTSDPNNQVSEVRTNLGFPVKSNYISNDSVSINEKNELEDNLIADNVKLEPDVKPEMVQPSSSDLVPDGGESHPKDVEEPQNKVSVEETYNDVTNTDMSQKNHSADLGSSEKLNLDRSSGDDSMEEDALESKQIDSNYNSEEVGERTKKFEVTNIKEESPFAAMDTDLPGEEKSIPENKDVAAASSDKRKLPEQGTVLSNEPSKRQRRWKSESNKVGDPRISNAPPAVLKRNLSRSDTVGANDTAKEREVPPSAKAATTSLRIDRFLRPFTLKAVQELLAKTGTVTSFWMDHIKTHCYITYSSVEEAVDTRNAVYNLQWPPNGGRHLVAEFVDPEEVKLRVEVPPPQPPVAPAAPEPPPTRPQPSPRQQNLKQQMSQQPTLPPPPPLSNPAPAREFTHLPPPPPPPPQEKVEAPIVTLDDLFRKTKTTPRIYYLPLSEEQVSAVLEERRKKSRK